MSHAAFPPPNGMGSFWRSQTGDLDSHRSTSELPAQCDIVIIGAGYSGAALVTHILSKRGDKAPSILVLEARQLCSGATGRNGGHLKPDSYYSIARLANEYGIDAAAEVADFEAANFEAVADFIRDEKVNCDFVITRAIDVQLSAEHQDRIQAGYRSLLAQGVKATKNTYCAPPEFAERLVRRQGAKGCFSYTAGHLWPYKLAHHIVREAVAKGVNLQAKHTRTDDIFYSRREWILDDNNEPRVVKTRQVIMATNAYTAAILPEYGRQDHSLSSHLQPHHCSGESAAVTNSYALRFNDWDFDYLIPGQTGASLLEAPDRRIFDIWKTVMGYSSDRLPRVGPIPDRSGMFIMGGFTGHGMPQVFLCASGLADMVLGTAEFGESGIPRLFEESRERLSDDRNRVLEIYQEPLSELTSKL